MLSWMRRPGTWMRSVAGAVCLVGLVICLTGTASADTKAADTKTADTKAADTKAADAKAADTKTADTKAADTKAADTKTADTKTADAKAADTKTADAKAADTKTADAKAADTKAADTKTADAKAADTKTADTKTADTKAADTKAADTKTADTKAADTKTADTKAADEATTAVDAPHPDAEEGATVLTPPADGATAGPAWFANSPIQAAMLDGVSGQFRILLWLGLSAALSWALTLFLYRRWFSPDRRRTLHRLTGRQRPAATAAGETRIHLPEIPAPLAAGDREESLTTAAATLTNAARQIASQIEQLQRLAGLEPGASRTPGLFEPIAGDDFGGGSPADDDLYDVEPRGLLELQSARSLRLTGSRAAGATGPASLRQRPGSPRGLDRHHVGQNGRFEGSNGVDENDALAGSDAYDTFDASDAFDASDTFDASGTFDASDAFDASDTFDASDAFDGDDPLTGLGLSAADLAEQDLLLEPLAKDESALKLEDLDDAVYGDDDAAVGRAADAPSVEDEAAAPRSIHPPARPRRTLGLDELTEMVALGLGDGELAGGGED